MKLPSARALLKRNGNLPSFAVLTVRPPDKSKGESIPTIVLLEGVLHPDDLLELAMVPHKLATNRKKAAADAKAVHVITVNGEKKEWKGTHVSYADVLALAGLPNASQQTVTFKVHGTRVQGTLTGELVEGSAPVRLHPDSDAIFNVADTSKA